MRRLMSTILMFIFLALPAKAHDWYPKACCSSEDCRPVPCDQLIEVTKGIRFGEYLFTKDMIKPSQDAFCHVCIHNFNNVIEGMGMTPMCVFIQQNF